VEDHRYARLLDARPERVEVRIGGRAPGHWTGPEADQTRAAREHALELRDRGLEVEEQKQRHREDALARRSPSRPRASG
jgi:hypothetical protein